MAQSLPKSQLHDIPLSVVDHGDTLRGGDKLNSKSNSLRRFFKMPHKKGSTNVEQMPASPSELQLETADYDEGDPETGLERKKVHSGSQRRFHLRLGSSNKYANDAAMDASDKSNNGPSASGSNSSSGKPGLKGSISSYWNTVFKRHGHLSHSKGDASIPSEEETQSDLSKLESQDTSEKADAEKDSNERQDEEHDDDDDEEEGEDDDELKNVQELLEEVHTLPLSEDIPL